MSGEKINELIIIGSGPAGYTAAIYAARASLSPLILAGPEPGGQLTTTTSVENFPGFPEGIQGPQLMINMQKQAERFGGIIKFETVTKVNLGSSPKKVWVGEKEYPAKALIIATGARSRTLRLPREKELWGKGIHTCATCDGFFYRGKNVAVIGGGDSAMEESNFLTKFADKIYIIHRQNNFRASDIMRDRTKNNPKIEILWNSEITKYLGQNKLTGVKVKNEKTGEEKELKIDGLFFAIGHIPNTEIFKGQLDLDDKAGYIAAQNNVYTNIEGVFAAGDCVDYIYRQAVSSAGLGCMAAIAAERWLDKA
ncbi:thioredoxin-disulfide reductase [Candidatus Falkowbacteria bacterium CG10_big_fil_rev_8_21_14_0_10_43_10]|uniref:Thioredoxin reductase n=1 Tax=Candidatus Falkowbacteria bacterium CG10_big_fil_rev_8_21_14_0_10_43_10 TaxID=1974567 RepID=A0A2H0V2T1_9BACT|nr:MAG: thioredoxin-disulfide reductase [Candidatus Falkowbacteria bacterium CG10_big_fil_rev_8_21_14_0_10_43_10]